MKTKTQKPIITLLGSDHLDNPGINVVNTQYDDVLLPDRQREMDNLVEKLKAYSPTKIALTIDDRFSDEVQENYTMYLKGAYQLTPSEYDQIGFRLAKALEHAKLYCVDYWPEHNPFLPDPTCLELLELIDYLSFAKSHNQEHLLPLVQSEDKFSPDEKETTRGTPEQIPSMIELHRQLNQPESLQQYHQDYLQIAKIGKGEQYPGANWVTHSWFARNLKIFVNLTRITESANDRILLIIGAGHVYLLQHFLEESGTYTIDPILQYLSTESSA